VTGREKEEGEVEGEGEGEGRGTEGGSETDLEEGLGLEPILDSALEGLGKRKVVT